MENHLVMAENLTPPDELPNSKRLIQGHNTPVSRIRTSLAAPAAGADVENSKQGRVINIAAPLQTTTATVSCNIQISNARLLLRNKSNSHYRRRTSRTLSRGAAPIPPNPLWKAVATRAPRAFETGCFYARPCRH